MNLVIPCFLELRATPEKPKYSPVCKDGGAHDFLKLREYVVCVKNGKKPDGKYKYRKSYRAKLRCQLCGVTRIMARKRKVIR